MPELDDWERRIVQCVMEDNAEVFVRSCYETSQFFEKSIIVNDLQASDRIICAYISTWAHLEA